LVLVNSIPDVLWPARTESPGLQRLPAYQRADLCGEVVHSFVRRDIDPSDLRPYSDKRRGYPPSGNEGRRDQRDSHRHGFLRGCILSCRLWSHSFKPLDNRTGSLLDFVRGAHVAIQIVNRMRVLRAEKKWSQAKLAETVGVSRQAINAIENGHHDPSVSLAYRIARALDADINDTFQLVDEGL